MANLLPRIVADLGNSRLKWGRLGSDGHLEATAALPVDGPSAWAEALVDWGLADQSADWAVSSVNPPVAEALGRFLDGRSASIRWYRSAADVPVPHGLDHAGTAGADRAWAVLAAWASRPGDRPGLVVSCGTALTVERIGADGVWQGGAIAAGLGLAARALNQGTAQLPHVEVDEPPPAWGRSTAPAISAGVFWGTVGAIRELLTRQAEGLGEDPWLVWTGGDSARLAPWIDWPGARVVPDLVLLGLAQAGFGGAVP